MDRRGDAADAASRARLPDQTGTAVRDGVSLAWASYGRGEPTLLMLPTWSIFPSRVWKAQVPYLSRHFRVVTFDGRGSGKSSRPTGAAAYTDGEYAADTLAVMDAAGIDRALLVALSRGGNWSVQVAAGHPERVLGLFSIGTACQLVRPGRQVDEFPWEARLSDHDGWAKFNRYYWLEGDYDDFLAFFCGELFAEPHSTKQIEDTVEWGLQIAPETLVDTQAGRSLRDGATRPSFESLCTQVACPVAVLHGVDDRIQDVESGRNLAALTGGSLILAEGSGHGVSARDPVFVNREIRRFAERIVPPVEHRVWTRASVRRKRALYISSPIGLGHARRDLAVAAELRTLHPDLQIDWLAQEPVITLLETAGERVHPASSWLANESGHVEHEAGEHDLHAFAAIRRMDEIMVNNFMVFDELTETEHYELVIGDEAWDVDYFLHENPELKRSAYAWFTDFVGWLPMPDGGPAEIALTADYNAEMIEQRRRFRRLRDRSIFVGNPGDIVPDDFGPGLPAIRGWTEDNFDFSGYITGFDAAGLGDREELRARLGYRPDERVCVVTVGGSAVGAPLLRRVLDAVPLARRLAPDLRFEVVAGPRIDPRSLPRRRGARVHGYLPNLTEHVAACDVAVVQGGLTTCMELTALRRPFIYVPLRHHFEQNFHVRRRLEQYRAGTHQPYEAAIDPDGLAEALVKELGRAVDYRSVESDGAARAAGLLSDLL